MKREKDVKFLEKSNWSQIKRGWIYEAIIPFIGKRPLDFFVPDPNNKYRGTIVGRTGEYKPSETQQIVVSLKQRKVIVISGNDVNSDNAFMNITVAPIFSVKDEDKGEYWYKEMIAGRHPLFLGFPET